jgi:OFA family oxalate/formate antiporter-like MFS transporter
MVAMAAIANLQYSWTLFTTPLTKGLGAKLSDVQWAFSVFIVCQTWLVPVEGWFIDKFGARLIVAIGGVLVGLGWIGCGFAESLTGLYVWSAVGGVGAGAVYGASIGTALKWFPDRRGLAAGLAAGAYGFGTAVTVIPIPLMIDGRGYAYAFIFWGVSQGLVVIAAAQLLAKPPAGWHPPGRGFTFARESQVSKVQASYTPLEMLRTPAFWIMYVMMALVAFGGMMIVAQIKPIAGDYGLDKGVLWFGASALSLALILDRVVNGFTRPFWGWVSDHIGRYTAMAITFTLEAAAIVLLLQFVHQPVAFVILSGFVFFAWGNIYSLFPAAIADVFGSEYATTNYGLQYTAKGTAAIFAAGGAAWLKEQTGSWTTVFWIAILCDLVAAGLAFFWLRPLVARLARRRLEHQPGGAAAPTLAPAPLAASAARAPDR